MSAPMAEAIMLEGNPKEFVPTWLQGAWRREYIRRAGPNKVLGEADSTVEVRYIQTSWAFVDIRRPKPEAAAAGSKEVAMAFAGVTSVSGRSGPDDDEGTPPLVSWHSCLDMDVSACPDAANRWIEAMSGSPRETEDKGHFKEALLEEYDDAYIERNQEGTLEELWVRIDDGGNQFIAARRGTALFVVAGGHFGFAAHAEDEQGSPATFVAGKASEDGTWRIEQSATDPTLEGKELVLPGAMEEWTFLAGSKVHPASVRPALKFSA
eukprot:CAMPEP_0197444554 /NCGR_PEP_ID=MMETSP1175-20131217/10014_1 /TAXON_ID=1003142 /ORGANISM="Triceratium dubium, Strain CCMP147" /LENGTH=265 /DNA_ID=CAMNT_0042975369 /DNA_START=59 /DNA_END=856 /DNA_ORIENTATION=-